ncbi:MAG: 2-dehydropantoate 2-reductase [Candidatus Bathyarchaeota archaeon]|nr:2-dehydropantoate 2-reductase [Candidatus Bathyarchaeota archaeon]
MEIDEVFILGAGAIGSIFGAFLSDKTNVTLIGSRLHVEAIRACGLQLTGDIDQSFSLTAETGISRIPRNSLVIVTTKTYDTAHAITGIKDMLKDDSILMVLQNGLGNKAIVRAIVGEQIEVLRGITMMASEFSSPGRIRFWKGETIVEKGKASDSIELLFNMCGLKTRVSDNIEQDVWSKLILNCVVNPLTTLFQVSNPKIISDNLQWVRHRVLEECLSIARAEGVEIKTSLEKIDQKILKYTNFSSMSQDIRKRKRTEIEFLNGKIVELGRKHRIQTPVNQTLTCLIKFLEETKVEIRR